MKIVSWNCNGRFRDKYKEIIKLNADIYVIQECEDPKISLNLEYKKFACNYMWIGENKNKGLGVFAKSNIVIDRLKWKSYCLKYFLPLRINKKIKLLAVWACKPYVEEYYIYQNINYNKYDLNTVIIGDFNSNKIWDRKHDMRSHSGFVNELKVKGLESVYHYVYKENQGEETNATFYLYRHFNRKYHIDHCFCEVSKIINYQVLEDINWLKISDHIPIILEIDIDKFK